MSYFGNTQGMVGDPGFFGTLFGAAKRVAGVALGLNPIVAGVRRFLPPPRASIFVPPRQAPISPILTSAAQGFGQAAGAAAIDRAFAAPSANGKCPSGYHLNRSSYFLMDGTFVPEGSRMVRNRTRNPYNKRAATKAASRLRSLGRGIKTIKKSVNAAATALK